jgi:hypothetical protein
MFLFMGNNMAILVYRVRVDSFEFPYPRELAGVYTDDMKESLYQYIDDFNKRRVSTWVPKLERQQTEMDVSAGILALNPPFELLCSLDQYGEHS